MRINPNHRDYITRVLGVMAMILTASYILFSTACIYVAYTGRTLVKVFVQVGFAYQYITDLVAHFIMIVFIVLFLIGLKYIFDATMTTEYQRLVSGGYAFIGGVSFVFLIGLWAGTFVYTRDYFTKKAHSSYYMMGAFAILIIFAIYKCLIAKEKSFSFMNFLLPIGAILAFMAGGIMREDAHYTIVGNGNRGLAIWLSILFGLGQAMPFIYLSYFELVYLPYRIKHPEEDMAPDTEDDSGEDTAGVVLEENNDKQ